MIYFITAREIGVDFHKQSEAVPFWHSLEAAHYAD